MAVGKSLLTWVPLPCVQVSKQTLFNVCVCVGGCVSQKGSEILEKFWESTVGGH